MEQRRLRQLVVLTMALETCATTNPVWGSCLDSYFGGTDFLGQEVANELARPQGRVIAGVDKNLGARRRGAWRR
jgi:hypothetical protein